MTASVKGSVLDLVFYALAKPASPEKTLVSYSTPEESQRFDEFSDKNKEGKLSSDEEYEVQEFSLAKKYVRLAKAYAFAKINGIGFE